MTLPFRRRHFDRRSFLQALAGAGALSAAEVVSSPGLGAYCSTAGATPAPFLAGVSSPIGATTSGSLKIADAGGPSASDASSTDSVAQPPVVDVSLRPAVGRAALVGTLGPPTEVWCYNGRVPGPEIRVRQGQRLRVSVENALPRATTVHWHGIRLPNAMDGVPHLTQPPIEAGGGRFVYEFDLPDAGTFWYHPHLQSAEQVDRGLSGALVVEEAAPIRVDRDLTWVLDDWRLTREARIADDFRNLMDATHDGRIGNAVTINGVVTDELAVRRNERIRLRLLNVANARIFALEFEGLAPQVIAYDGHPVRPHEPDGGRIVLGPGMRADVVLDLTGKPGSRTRVIDHFYPHMTYRLVELVYAVGPPLRDRVLDAPIELPANPVAEPVLADAQRHRIELAGGMMGGMRGGPTAMREMMRRGLAWTLNDVAADSHTPEPLFTVARGRTAVIEVVNTTAWWHPIHLHGFAFRELARNGRPVAHAPLRDTALLGPDERTEVAFVADNPGLWMLHCHVLEHQESGMMAVIRVT